MTRTSRYSAAVFSPSASRDDADGLRSHLKALFLQRTALLGGAFVLMVVMTWLLYADFQREEERQYSVKHTYEVLNGFQRLASTLEQGETAQRDYLLTGDEHYLRSFQAALDAERIAHKALRRLAADNYSQNERLDALEQLTHARFLSLWETVETRRRGAEDALAKVRTGEGERIMDQCRAMLRAIDVEERGLLAKRTEAAGSQALRTRWVLGLGSSSLLVLLVIAGAVIEKDIRNRESARQAVRKSQERLRLALDSADAGTWEWNLRTHENVWSDELWRLYGLEPHSRKPSYEAWRQVIHPDDRAEAERAVLEASRAGAELSVEFRVRYPDGNERWLLARAQPLRDSKGQAECYLGIALDITHRKQAEEAVRQREQNLRRFTEAAPVGIAMFDLDMRYLAASRRYRDDRKLREGIEGRNHYEVFPEIPEHWREIHRRCLAGAVERHEGERFLRADGSEQWVRWEIQPWHQASGEIGGLVLFSEDTTGQTHAELALKVSEARLRLAQQVARIGTFERNLQTGISTWTPELEAIYDLPPGGFGGTQAAWEKLIHPDDVEEAARRVDQALETGKFEAEWRAVRKDGTLRWIAGRGWVFKDDAGKPLRLIGVHIDITEAKQAEEALRQTHANLREAQRVARLGSWHWDRTGKVTGSEEMYSIFGIDPNVPFPGREELERLFTPDSWKRLSSSAQVTAQTGIAFEIDLEVIRADGERAWATARGEATRDARGNIAGFIGTLQDVTRRKRAEEEILARNASLHAISRVFSEALNCETEESLGQACLSIAKALTGSTFGFIGEIGETGRLHAIAVGDPEMPGSAADGLCQRVILEEKGFYSNAPQFVQELTAFLGVPLVHAGKTIGLIAVANREGGYASRDLEAMEALAPAIVQAFMRKRAEQAQRASEAQFRTLANAIPQLCWMANADGWIYWFNQRWYEYTGTTQEQMDGWGWQSVHAPETLPNVLDRWQASIASGEPLDMVFPLRCADGTFHPFLTRTMPVRDQGGNIVQWFGTNTDITAQLATEAALRQASEQRRIAMDAAGLGAWEYRIETDEILWDARCQSMFGVEPNDRIPYREAIQCVHPDHRAAIEEALNAAIRGAGGGVYSQEYRIVWPDGSVHWIASHGRMHVEGGNGHRESRFTGVKMDITERKQAELEIRQLNSQLEERVRQRTSELEIANEELESFSYSVSHDLRAPLRGIDGWSLALAEDYAAQLDARALQYLDRVRSETQRMGLLIDDMLQLSRISSTEMRLIPIDLTGIARGIAVRLREANSDRRIEFVIEPDLTAPGDARLLEIALTNLLANAVKFTGPRESARIEFGVTNRGGEHVFHVRDNGVGFDMAYASTLFGAFQRLHKTTEFPGTGIGLAIVQRVIHRHSGRVWAEAERGQGATFYFTIGTTV